MKDKHGLEVKRAQLKLMAKSEEQLEKEFLSEFMKEEHIPGPSGVVQHNAAGFRVWKTRA